MQCRRCTTSTRQLFAACRSSAVPRRPTSCTVWRRPTARPSFCWMLHGWPSAPCTESTSKETGMARSAGGKQNNASEIVTRHAAELQSLREQLAACTRDLDEQRARAAHAEAQSAALGAAQKQLAAASASVNAALDRLSANVMLAD